MDISIIKAQSQQQIISATHLFKEYADSLDFTLSFQNFEKELQQIPVMYGSPKGALLLVEVEGKYIGVAGLRNIENQSTCEIKRMYIKPEFQGKGLGKLLIQALIDEAIALHYEIIKLDTLGPKMPAAVALYKSFGFVETPPYNYNPYEGVLYFEKKISNDLKVKQ